MHEALPTKLNLRRRHCVSETSCPICEAPREDAAHVFLHCPWLRPVWFGSFFQLAPDPSILSLPIWLEAKLSQLSNLESGSEQLISYLGFLLWGVWKMRNNGTFRGERPNPVLCLNLAVEASKEFLLETTTEFLPISGGHVNRGIRHWTRPPLGFLKCNTDAGFLRVGNKAAGGYIFKDDKGCFVWGNHRQLHAASALAAEALILREAVFAAMNLNMDRVVFEADNLGLIEACREQREKGEILAIVKDIRKCKLDFPNWIFSWTRREGNECAHVLARLALCRSIPPHWCAHLPQELSTTINRDMVASAMRESGVAEERSNPPDPP
ncbi:uncharacterized protein LOC130718917 [Lotus japonicus]|uniref:uncharacterized protein LOC130718917 n=1 Tax=Lotus japonicus TaxID=34305 RepID=UPI002583F2D3|nr:uncharacterized protein LOC130718917 [Lotus japonicus]